MLGAGLPRDRAARGRPVVGSEIDLQDVIDVGRYRGRRRFDHQIMAIAPVPTVFAKEAPVRGIASREPPPGNTPARNGLMLPFARRPDL